MRGRATSSGGGGGTELGRTDERTRAGPKQRQRTNKTRATFAQSATTNSAGVPPRRRWRCWLFGARLLARMGPLCARAPARPEAEAAAAAAAKAAAVVALLSRHRGCNAIEFFICSLASGRRAAREGEEGAPPGPGFTRVPAARLAKRARGAPRPSAASRGARPRAEQRGGGQLVAATARAVARAQQRLAAAAASASRAPRCIQILFVSGLNWRLAS